jgi:hypothetical protein
MMKEDVLSAGTFAIADREMSSFFLLNNVELLV